MLVIECIAHSATKRATHMHDMQRMLAYIRMFMCHLDTDDDATCRCTCSPSMRRRAFQSQWGHEQQLYLKFGKYMLVTTIVRSC